MSFRKGKVFGLLTIFALLAWGCDSGVDAVFSPTYLTDVSITGSAELTATGEESYTAQPASAGLFFDASKVSYEWSVQPETYAELAANTGATVALKAKNTTTADQTVTLTVKASYAGVEKTATKEVTIKAAPENPPVGEDAVTAVEINASATEIGSAGTTTLTAKPTKTGNPTITYAWAISEGSDYATLSATSGESVTLTGKNTTATAQKVKVTVTAKYTVDGEEKSVSAATPTEITVAAKTTYVVAGKYNLSTSAVEGFTVDGTAGGKWTAYGNTDGKGLQTHDNIVVTSEIDSNGLNLYSDTAKGVMTFSLTSAMKVTFAGKSNNFGKAGKITTTNGKVIQVSTSAADNATVATNGLAATIGDDASKSAVVYLEAGDYTVLGNESSEFKLQTIIFEAAKLTPDPNTGVSAETGWVKEELSIINGAANTANVLLPSGVTEETHKVIYSWRVNNEVVLGENRSTLTLSGTNYVVGKTYLVTAWVSIDGVIYSRSTTIVYTQE
ncbi:MAG: hypothetical protein IJS09_09650 [Treponema sp.]|nr:hypothetical protein [Treponema sp.]